MKYRSLSLFAALALTFVLLSCGEREEEPEVESAPVEEYEELPEPGEMVRVPGGTYSIGTDEGGDPPFPTPAHQVEVDPFYIDVYEVTNGQFAEFATETDYEIEGNWREFYSLGRELYPVINVTWEDARQYCEWAGKRLPTEVEWEAAARGSEAYPYPWGEEFNANYSNVLNYGVQNTLEVGQVREDKSPFGAYDMLGNVQEWTADTFRAYRGSKAAGNPAFSGRYKSVRGGFFQARGDKIFLWTRMGFLPGSQFSQGFRCARDAEEEASEE